MNRKSKRCTLYAAIFESSTSVDTELVAQTVAALGRNVAVRMGHWMAHPSGVLARGTMEEQGMVLFGADPDRLLALYQKTVQPKGAGTYQDAEQLAAALVRAWRWELATMQKPTTVDGDATALVQEFGAVAAMTISKDWSHDAPAQLEREHWHRVFSTIRNAQEPKRAVRKPTTKQLAAAQEHAAKVVKAWGRDAALAHAQDWGLRHTKRSDRAHYARMAEVIQAMPA